MLNWISNVFFWIKRRPSTSISFAQSKNVDNTNRTQSISCVFKLIGLLHAPYSVFFRLIVAECEVYFIFHFFFISLSLSLPVLLPEYIVLFCQICAMCVSLYGRNRNICVVRFGSYLFSKFGLVRLFISTSCYLVAVAIPMPLDCCCILKKKNRFFLRMLFLFFISSCRLCP